MARSKASRTSRPRARPAAGTRSAGATAGAAPRSAPRSASPEPRRDETPADFGLRACGLLLLTLAAYLPALGNGFIWDDDDYVTANPTLRSLGGLARIWFEPGAVAQYYPLTFTSLWLDYQIGGLEPFGYHLVNVLLHAATAILAWRVLRRLAVPGAWLGAALFAVHPVHVESVAWVTERKNVLSGAFALGAALAYLRFAGIGPRPTPPAATRERRWYAAALALFVCGLLSKTVVATLPAALLVVLWWKRGRIDVRDALPLAPFFAVGAALALLTVELERSHVGAIGADWDLSFVDRCLIAGRAVWFYLGKLAWPASLSFVYPRWTIDAGAVAPYAFPAAAAGLAAGLFALRGRFGWGPLVAYVYFVLTLGPALGFFDVFPMRYSFVADHFQYLASLGPLALAGAVATVAAAAVAGRRPTARRTAAACAAAVLAGLGLLTAEQSRSYRDLKTLWTDTIAVNPSAWMAHNNLGLLLLEEGRTDAAMQHFRAAIAAKPDDSFARNNLGRAVAATGDLDGAIRLFREAVEIEPASAEPWSNLGNAFAAQGRWDEAMASYRRAIETAPRFADAWSNLGNVLFLTGRTEEALAAYDSAVRLDPGFADARYNLGVALASAGRLADAEAQLAEAIRLRPSYAEAHHQLGLVLASQSRWEEAAARQREALRLRPGWEEASRALAAASTSR